MTSALDPSALRIDAPSAESGELRRVRADLELRLRASGAVRGWLEEIGGLAWLLAAVAAERCDARLELRDAACVVEIDLRDGELAHAACTATDGELARGSEAVERALGMTEATFVVAEAARSARRKIPSAHDVATHVALARTSVDEHASEELAAERADHAPDARSELEAASASGGRDLARLADVVVTASTLAIGLIGAVLAMSGAPLSSAGDPTALEGRAPASLPPLTWSNVVEGRFTGAFEAHLADRFPARGPLLDLESTMRRARGFALEEEVVVYGVSSEALDLGADPEADLDVEEPSPSPASTSEHGATRRDPITPEADVLVSRPEAAPASADRSQEASRPAEGHRVARRASTRITAGVLIRDGRAMQGFGGDPRGAPEYARTLNAIEQTVRDRATVYSVIVPTAQEFYLPAGSRSRVREERPNILGTYARLAPGIRTVDAHAELAAHTDENIYFRTDHHWTGLGAYYGYRAFCRAAHIEPVPLERMERRVLHRAWLGSLYRLTRDRGLRPDLVEMVIPPAQAEVRIPRGRQDRIVPLLAERSSGYGVFLNGDHPIMRVRTSTRNGRRAILVKNSYGNAFAVYLVSHYEELVFVDYRYFRGSLRQLLDESAGPTDLIFLNGALTANSRAHSTLIRGLLHARR